jgi:diguanylate cyclase (GGDEF)-like protein
LGNPFSLIMIDVDHFKQINDRHGHSTGDFVLKQIASLLQEHLRDTDILARWGGEEFMLLLPGATIEGAFGFAERCRRRVEDSEILRSHGVTISLGVIECVAGMDRSQLLNELDAALYRSKQTGRNSTSRALPEASEAGAINTETAGLKTG